MFQVNMIGADAFIVNNTRDSTFLFYYSLLIGSIANHLCEVTDATLQYMSSNMQNSHSLRSFVAE